METAKAKPAVKGKQYAFEQYDLTGANKNQVSFSKSIVEAKAATSLMAQYIRVYRTNQRQGTAKAKGRSEVAGTTKKIYKQKGTGRARHGSQRAPIFKGGGVVGGPLPKDYSLTINRKQKKQVLFAAIGGRINEGSVVGLSIEAAKTKPKTKVIADFLKTMKIQDKKVLFILPEERVEAFVLSMRNLPKATFLPVTNVNAYQILDAEKIIFINDSFNELEKHFSE